MTEGARGDGPEPALYARFPSMRHLPRVPLASHFTPVEPCGAARALWVKRDDLSGSLLGGNKVRALEFLLAGVRAGDEVLTVGGTGSTHALATSVHARALGARASVIRWPQEMNDSARAVDVRLRAIADELTDAGSVVESYARALVRRARARARRGRARLHWIPAGGTTALGILGHVSAALELAEQVRRGDAPPPERVVLPLGSGGTAAGLWLGLALAGLSTTVVAVRVVPRIVANAARVRRLAAGAARLLERETGERLPSPDPGRLVVATGWYGGAYGRETLAAKEAAACFAESHGAGDGSRVDATYSAKAFAAALALCDERETLFWLTFDGRWMRQ